MWVKSEWQGNTQVNIRYSITQHGVLCQQMTETLCCRFPLFLVGDEMGETIRANKRALNQDYLRPSSTLESLPLCKLKPNSRNLITAQLSRWKTLIVWQIGRRPIILTSHRGASMGHKEPSLLAASNCDWTECRQQLAESERAWRQMGSTHTSKQLFKNNTAAEDFTNAGITYRVRLLLQEVQRYKLEVIFCDLQWDWKTKEEEDVPVEQRFCISEASTLENMTALLWQRRPESPNVWLVAERSLHFNVLEIHRGQTVHISLQLQEMHAGMQEPASCDWPARWA